MRTEVQRRLGGFIPELPHSGDTEIWLRLAAEGGVVKVYADQAFRRLHATNMSLHYSDTRRLREQQRAFDAHFDYMGGRLPNRATFQLRLHETLATASFWIAVRAFDTGGQTVMKEALSYTLGLHPPIAQTGAYRRLQVKRLLGHRAWHTIEQLMGRNTPQQARL